MREDLLALTPEDLTLLTNRGTVKRALRELDRVEWELTETDGDVTVEWSDGPKTILRSHAILDDARCTCPSTGICRHVVRAVLAYRNAHPEEAARPRRSWNPGDIDDDTLEATLDASTRRRARDLFEDGIVAELVAGPRPSARFHRLRHQVVFLVPDDPRYTHCDCADRAPCRHVALAVEAFRELARDADGGLVVTAQDQRVSGELLDQIERTLENVSGRGISRLPSTWSDRQVSLEERLRAEAANWPADILRDLRTVYERYHAHDARFDAVELADLVGELVIRLDALRNDQLPIPRLFVRGDDDTTTKLGQTRFIGMGCVVREYQHFVDIAAMFQAESTGTVVALRHRFRTRDDAESPPTSLARLARRLVVSGRDLHSLGAGQVVAKSATLHPSHEIEFSGRSSVYAQTFAWEQLLPPVHAASFAVLRTRLDALPPRSLRPRRFGENFHVCDIASVTDVRFSVRDNAVRATLVDREGEEAGLFHPFTSRNRAGTERLLTWLRRAPDAVVFVAGNVRAGPHGLVVQPSGIVFDDGGERTLVQPWIDELDDLHEAADSPLGEVESTPSALDRLRASLAEAVGAVLVSGADEGGRLTSESWQAIRHEADSLGMGTVQNILDQVDGTASEPLLTAAVCSRLLQELAT